MYWWIAAIAVALAVFQLSAHAILNRHTAFDKAASAVQALATTVAIMFAGYWYIYERKGQPQADIGLQVIGLHVAPEQVVLEARFGIKNLGATLLEVGDTDARLQAMNADSLPLAKIAALGRKEFPDRIDGRDAFDDGALMWPTVRWFTGGRQHSIEPGESDVRLVDFTASCKNTAMRVYFAMRRPGTEEVWSDVATVSLSGLCARPVGSKEVLSGGKD